MTGGQAKIFDITAEIKKRRDIQRANADENWQQIKASFALSDIALDATDDELSGRLLSGELTLEQVLNEIKRKYGYE